MFGTLMSQIHEMMESAAFSKGEYTPQMLGLTNEAAEIAVMDMITGIDGKPNAKRVLGLTAHGVLKSSHALLSSKDDPEGRFADTIALMAHALEL